jgi:hypothetical protein
MLVLLGNINVLENKVCPWCLLLSYAYFGLNAIFDAETF